MLTKLALLNPWTDSREWGVYFLFLGVVIFFFTSFFNSEIKSFIHCKFQNIPYGIILFPKDTAYILEFLSLATSFLLIKEKIVSVSLNETKGYGDGSLDKSVALESLTTWVHCWSPCEKAGHRGAHL